MRTNLPLGALIDRRRAALGLTDQTLGARLGLSNVARAAGRVAALRAGSITNRKSRAALSRLAAALEVSDDEVSAALTETERVLALQAQADAARRRELERQAWASYCEHFQPHAVIETERDRPSQITFCGLLGGPSGLRALRLDAAEGAQTYARQALEAMLEQTARWGRDARGRRRVLFFGAVVGVTVNYAPDLAVRYDLELAEVGRSTRARRLGEVVVRF